MFSEKLKKRSVNWDEYQTKLCEYNKMLRKAGLSSRQLFCKQVGSVSYTSKINKFHWKTAIQADTLLEEEGNKMEPSINTANIPYC